MDIMETFTVDVTGGLWSLPVGAIAICASVIALIVHIAFAIALFRDATNLPTHRKPIFVGPMIWFLGALVGGMFVAAIYWVMHHSRLNQSIPVTPPEN